MSELARYALLVCLAIAGVIPVVFFLIIIRNNRRRGLDAGEPTGGDWLDFGSDGGGDGGGD